MSTIQAVSSHQADSILQVAIKEEFQGVISFHGPTGWRTYKCSFHSHRREDDEIGMAVNGIMDASGGPARGDTVGVSFRFGHKKCMFRAVLEHVVANGTTQIVHIKRSGEIRQLQRRAYERAVPPRGLVVPVRFRLADSGEGSTNIDHATRHGQLEDISAGGMRVKTAASNDVRIGATYRCIVTVKQGSPALILDAVLRHADPDGDGRVSLGFQFVGMEATTEGDKMLASIAHLVSRFKRSRSRHSRGMARK